MTMGVEQMMKTDWLTGKVRGAFAVWYEFSKSDCLRKCLRTIINKTNN